MTAPLDADWSTLPAKPDYVALLHELIFHLAGRRATRNVDVGNPLVLDVAADFAVENYAFFGPGETELAAKPAGDETRPLVRLDETQVAGVYRFAPKIAAGDAAGQRDVEHFVVNFDRGESDLTPLDETERALLSQDRRMAFARTIDELKQGMFTDDSRTELWYLLLFVFLAILVGEVLMTRRLVRGGHAVSDDDLAPGLEDESTAVPSPY